MIRIKTLSWPLVSALLGSAVVPATAEVIMSTSSNKTFRQDKTGLPTFTGGSFYTSLRDGNALYVPGCARKFFWPPNIPMDPCPGGATGFVTFGKIDPEFPGARYYWMTEVIPAISVEPLRPELCTLEAAPASDLPRPTTNFTDTSYGVYYNLLQSDVSESVVTRYEDYRTYSAKEFQKFEDEIVPGVYHYSFPQLSNPLRKVAISPVIFQMPEGYTKKNNQRVGVRFTPERIWTKKGFMELSYFKPNRIKWSGFAPTFTHPSVDSLYFSMRFLSNLKDPKSTVSYLDPVMLEYPASVFPTFVSGGNPRILLPNPFVSTFTVPPVFRSGTTAVVQLELERNFQTGAVTYDFSTRKFEVPIMIVNRYSEYQELAFAKETKNVGLLDDFDKDGFNNLTEWILESRAEESASIPVNPVATYHLPVRNSRGVLIFPLYYGFTVIKQEATRPANVVQTLQRSTDGGKTWKKFMKSDANWNITVTSGEIKVESALDDGSVDKIPIPPPGTENHLYRMKITLRK